MRKNREENKLREDDKVGGGERKEEMESGEVSKEEMERGGRP